MDSSPKPHAPESMKTLEDLNMPAQSSEFQANCEECAGLCCVLLDVHGLRGVLLKTKNTVCEHLEKSDSDGPGRCKIYANRKYEGYPFCQEFDCHGSGQAVTRYAKRINGILPDGTVTEEIMNAFGFYTKIAQFAVKERQRLETEPTRYEPEWAFLEKCEAILRWFAQNPEEQVRIVREMGDELALEHQRSRRPSLLRRIRNFVNGKRE